MTSSRPLLVACTFFVTTSLSPLAFGQRSAADIETARQLYNQGVELRDRGDHAGALEKFKAAHALGNTPITGVELCKTHAALKQPVEAREVCLSVARIPPLAGETDRSREARSEAGRVAEDVKPMMAGLRVRIFGVPKGRDPTVLVDGAPMPLEAIGVPRAVNPGTHAVSARVGQGAETRATIDVREGETREIQLTVQAPPPSEPPPPAAAPPPQGQPMYAPPPKEKKSSGLATMGWGLAATGLLFGTIGGVVALDAKGDLDDNCTELEGTPVCGRDDHGTLDRAKTWATISTVGFIGAGIGLTLGFLGTIASSSGSAAAPPKTKTARSGPSIAPVFGLGGGGFHGTF